MITKVNPYGHISLTNDYFSGLVEQAAKQCYGIAAMGHKMLPLFTLLGANELVALLKELEASRGEVFSEKIKEKSFSALAQIEDIVVQVEE
jgi:hypothetical protein